MGIQPLAGRVFDRDNASDLNSVCGIGSVVIDRALLQIALRDFRQHKFTIALNIACLTLGLVCFLGVYELVVHLGSDRHIPHSDRGLGVAKLLMSDCS